LEKIYCRHCEKEVTYTVIAGTQESVVKGVSIHTQAEHAYCLECRNKVFVPKLSQNNLNRVDEAYRKHIGRIQLQDIRALLRQYHIGAKPLSLMLNWGECTILRYLRGQLPDKEHSDRLLSLKDPSVFSGLFEKNRRMLKDVAQRKVEKALSEQLNVKENIQENLKHDMPKAALLLFFNQKPGDCNGNKPFQLERFIQAVLYLSQKGIPLVQLNYWLWLTDLLHFKRKKESVFGIPYRRYEGMVAPDRHFWIYGALTETDIVFVPLQNEWMIQAIHAPILEDFTEFEKEILKNIQIYDYSQKNPLIPDMRLKMSTVKPFQEIPFSLALEWIQ
jgi:hypothetical protein